MNFCCAQGNCFECKSRRIRRRCQRAQQALYQPKPPASKQNKIVHDVVKTFEVPE